MEDECKQITYLCMHKGWPSLKYSAIVLAIKCEERCP